MGWWRPGKRVVEEVVRAAAVQYAAGGSPGQFEPRAWIRTSRLTAGGWTLKSLALNRDLRSGEHPVIGLGWSPVPW